MSKQTQSPKRSFIEPILAEQLKRVEAPADLWLRLKSAPASQQRGSIFPRLAWAAAMAALVTAAAVGGHAAVQKKSLAVIQPAPADNVRRTAAVWTVKPGSVNAHNACHLCHVGADI